MQITVKIAHQHMTTFHQIFHELFTMYRQFGLFLSALSHNVLKTNQQYGSNNQQYNVQFLMLYLELAIYYDLL